MFGNSERGEKLSLRFQDRTNREFVNENSWQELVHDTLAKGRTFRTQIDSDQLVEYETLLLESFENLEGVFGLQFTRKLMWNGSADTEYLLVLGR